MDTWFKYKHKSHKLDLTRINIPEAICYGNLLIHKLVWRAIHNKNIQRLVNKFFDTASIILQSTIIQKQYESDKYKEILEYIDNTTKQLNNTQNSAKEIAMLLGNLSEYTEAHYTFTELIAFVRFIAAKI